MFLFKYGCREHLEQFDADGTMQIGTVFAYDEATHGPAIGDDQEGLSYQTFTDESTKEMVARGDPLPTGAFGLPMFGAPDVRDNVLQRTNASFNYGIFCVSHALHQHLCKDFATHYDCALVILRPFVFFHEVTNALQSSGLVEQALFRHVSDVHYQRRSIAPDDDVLEVFTKEPRYAHQAEVRAIWNIGEHPKQKFYRFKSPAAALCCRLIPFEAMPNYGSAATREDVEAAMKRAVTASYGKGF